MIGLSKDVEAQDADMMEDEPNRVTLSREEEVGGKTVLSRENVRTWT